jgi:hypothetical protein
MWWATVNMGTYRPSIAELHLLSGLEALPFAFCPIPECTDDLHQIAQLLSVLPLHDFSLFLHQVLQLKLVQTLSIQHMLACVALH